MEVGEIFKEQVKKRLEELGWTHETLAKRIGIGRGTVSTYLQDKSKTAPQADTLLRWADALGVSVEWLLGREVVFHERVASQEQIDALKAHAKSIGLSKDRLALVLFALEARDAAVSVALGGLPS